MSALYAGGWKRGNDGWWGGYRAPIIVEPLDIPWGILKEVQSDWTPVFASIKNASS
ncbi:hypothetical protein ACFFUT_17095 [Pseudohalocynthiibacter aestuariivivens]|uniref:Uncharacterized protein n=1 Tax=Pseudohalocynthiibacter aestuariivivens TaxID=1591409 RepID=A0ABV5JL94_9RHOB|nr:hypothetical protein [Pseudohalocynthiibacter aestuariivivens]MBS9716741.1 hypothetical protein [Pseudohalocynthiibacter aestuariivivens]